MQPEPVGVEDMLPYFLGSIVLIKQEANPEADVLDGQQRLTTITLLRSAIRKQMTEDNASELTRLIYQKGSEILGTADQFRLSLRERDRELFQTYVQRENGMAELLKLTEELPESHHHLRTNARMFAEQLCKLPEQKLLRLAQFIVRRCYLVVVSTPGLDSAYRIFSVLNSRGLDLSATDILKSEIVGAVDVVQRDAYTRRWEDFEEDLGRDAFTDLFSHIRMVYRKAKPKGTLLREIREHVPELKQPTVFLDKVLKPMARAYAEILGASYESASHAEAINSHLEWLNRLEFTDWMPPALAFMARHRQESARVLGFFKDLERLAYAMLIRKSGVNERIERFAKLTAEIEREADLSRRKGGDLRR